MAIAIQQYYREILRLEYASDQFEALIRRNPVRFARVQVPLRENREKQAKIEQILSKNPDNPGTEEERLMLKRHIIDSELSRAEKGVCPGCAFYLPNRLIAESGYLGMIKKIETLPANSIACNLYDVRLGEPTKTSCEMFAESLQRLPDDDFKALEDRIATWAHLQRKYDACKNLDSVHNK